MTKADRQKVFDKYCGHCAYCGVELTGRWHVDHLKALNRDSKYDKENNKLVLTGTCQHPENDHFDNYMPACPSCNITKHANSLEGFRKMISHFIVSLNRDSNQYKFAKRYGLIQETGEEVKFFFEMFQQPVNL